MTATENRVLITQTINALPHFKAIIWHCIIHSFALQFVIYYYEIWISFLLCFGCYDCWLNEIRTQYCISGVNEITSFSTKAAFNYVASRPDRHLTRYCNNALDPNYLSAHDAVSPSVTSLIFVEQRPTGFSISRCTNLIYWSPKITIIYYVEISRKVLLHPTAAYYLCRCSRTGPWHIPRVCTSYLHQRIQSSFRFTLICSAPLFLIRSLLTYNTSYYVLSFSV